MSGLTFDSFMKLFPMRVGAVFDSLVQSIRAGGLQIAITLHGGAILNGCNRYHLTGRPPAEKRAQREVHLGEATYAASARLNQKRYGVIYPDSPWRFELHSRDTGVDRTADNYCRTESVEAICAMRVAGADDWVLLLWATVPMLPETLRVMAAWSFAYNVWGKGITARLIALAMSESKSGVISRAHRIGLSAPPSPLLPPVERRPPAPVRLRPVVPEGAPMFRPAAVRSCHFALKRCYRWRVCQQQVQPGTSWRAAHKRIIWVKRRETVA